MQFGKDHLFSNPTYSLHRMLTSDIFLCLRVASTGRESTASSKSKMPEKSGMIYLFSNCAKATGRVAFNKVRFSINQQS